MTLRQVSCRSSHTSRHLANSIRLMANRPVVLSLFLNTICVLFHIRNVGNAIMTISVAISAMVRTIQRDDCQRVSAVSCTRVTVTDMLRALCFFALIHLHRPTRYGYYEDRCQSKSRSDTWDDPHHRHAFSQTDCEESANKQEDRVFCGKKGADEEDFASIKALRPRY